jgi:hypothetical protein
MKICLDIPDWVEGKHLYVFAGIELVAYKYNSGGWMVKTGRCSMCGSCCVLRDGPCEHLVEDGKRRLCGLGSGRPFSCCLAAQPKNRVGCTEDYDPVL